MSIVSQYARIIYNGYNVASTNYVYTSNASTGADDGWYSCKTDHVALQVCAATLTAASLTYRIEGRSDTYTRPAEIYTDSITSAQSIDEIINITEKVKEVRIGVKLSAVATPNSFHCGLVQSEVK